MIESFGSISVMSYSFMLPPKARYPIVPNTKYAQQMVKIAAVRSFGNSSGFSVR